jgi:CHAT domain-containing protein
VESIAGQLEQNDVKTRVFMYDEGTEETFKALSGQSQSIIHIATHGFYFSEQELRQQGRQLVFLSDENSHLDDALNYSGLLFAGANYALQGNRLPDGIEDGVLTAREIAQVDLGHVDLVVLSACQTGLGEIRDDGVFGIQRGFKKAGARSLLMSLWKVDDEATDLMMTRFYERLMDGRELHRAFAEAQQAVREGGYPEPYFWASFILLDGQQ